MIVSIMQPAYLPWLGYFDRIAKSDLHIILDNVQISNGNKDRFTNRNRIRQPAGWTWLTVPLRAGTDPDIDKLRVSDTQPWQSKHLQSLKGCYSRGAHFADYREQVEAIYTAPADLLMDIIDPLTAFQLDAFGISKPTRRSSEMATQGSKADLILNLCIEAGATRYLSGPFGREYLNLEAFEKAGIAIDWHDYAHPTYKQSFAGFEPYMAALDLLFNHGRDSRAILSSGNPSS